MRAFTQYNELLAQIQHPNILPVYDPSQAEDQTNRVLRYAKEGGVQLYLSSAPAALSGIWVFSWLAPAGCICAPTIPTMYWLPW